MEETMKAVIWTAYGPPEALQLQEIEKPVPQDNEILIRIHATTVTAGDCEARRLQLPMGLGLLMRLFVGIRKPKNILVLGQEFSGEIEVVGDSVTRFKPGDQVFGGTGFTKGTYAEYVCLEEDPEEGVLALKPNNMNYREAASVTTGGLEALHFLRQANIQPGQKVLINGAGGSVTAVDSAEKLEMLKDLGASQVIDYTQEDFTQNGQSYDVIFDVIGKSHFRRSLESLAENGVYLIANPRLGNMLRGKRISIRGAKKVITEMTVQKSEDLEYLKDLIEAGKLRSIIDQILPLEEMVKAHHYVESGAKKGNLVIEVVPENKPLD
jgi:NADPH:quinone reductase-like Zn-dependent oxidoreductase